MARIGRMVAGGIAAVALAGCATSTSATQSRATATSTSAASGAAAAGLSVSASAVRVREPAISYGPGRRDRAWLVYLGGSGRDNWELVVQMTALGQQSIRFTGDPVLPGNTAAPTIAGAVGTDVFVKVDAGASTQFWTIFKPVGGRIRQVTVKGQPVRIPVGGSVTHQDGFRCVGAQFVTVGEGTNPPRYTTWTYQRDTFAWSGAELVPLSSRTGTVTSAKPADPPAAYTGVSCGGLPQYAPPYPSAG
jgi:hypothetical protein